MRVIFQTRVLLLRSFFATELHPLSLRSAIIYIVLHSPTSYYELRELHGKNQGRRSRLSRTASATRDSPIAIAIDRIARARARVKLTECEKELHDARSRRRGDVDIRFDVN